MESLSQKDIERFWGNILKTDDPNKCWIWTSSRHSQGYGRFQPAGGRKLLAHRIAWQLTFGEIPDGLDILHSCDNPPCCNPNHLHPGTHIENMQDKLKRGRMSNYKGEHNPAHKLSLSQVDEIRHRYGYNGKNGESSLSLSKEFGVSDVEILDIVKHKKWK